ncbi:MAG: hypothetical protein EBW59_06915 [Betaproteobacteria bacterium]|nr:hypothetical protein [Betaproteobacteria bacterium]
MFEEENLNNLNESFNELNKIREESLTISREIVQLSSKCIRSIHRNNFEIALNYIESASEKLIKLKQISKKVSEISYAGYVLDAEREYVEAVLFYKFEVLKYIHLVIFKELGTL